MFIATRERGRAARAAGAALTGSRWGPLLLLGLVLCAPVPCAAGAPGFPAQLLAHVLDRYGADARARVLDWQGLILGARGLPEREKLELVNRFFNRLRYVEDLEHWGLPDYWATPVELLGTLGGDCEDFSIAKYFTLREMGVPEARLRITYVHSLALRRAHMVLAYYPSSNADPLILDNFVDEIRPGSLRRDLQPLYGFNRKGIFVGLERGKSRRLGRASRIRPWREVSRRLAREADRPAAGGLLVHDAGTH